MGCRAENSHRTLGGTNTVLLRSAHADASPTSLLNQFNSIQDTGLTEVPVEVILRKLLLVKYLARHPAYHRVVSPVEQLRAIAIANMYLLRRLTSIAIPEQMRDCASVVTHMLAGTVTSCWSSIYSGRLRALRNQLGIHRHDHGAPTSQ